MACNDNTYIRVQGNIQVNVYDLLCVLESYSWNKGKFGLGCVQWTGGRTKTLVEVYMEVTGGNSSITFDEVVESEGKLISRELNGSYYSIYSNWLTANAGNLDSGTAGYNAGYNLCVKYEIPKDYNSKAPSRAKTAEKLYNIMKVV
ncbi:phage tail tip lysozyme [Lacrimispora brassicae]